MLRPPSGLRLTLTASSEDRSLHFLVSGSYYQPCKFSHGLRGNELRETLTTRVELCTSAHHWTCSHVLESYWFSFPCLFFSSFPSPHQDLLENFTFSKEVPNPTETLYRTGSLQHANDLGESSHEDFSYLLLKNNEPKRIIWSYAFYW